MKGLIEKRNTMLEQMKSLVTTAKVETRALSQEEDTEYEKLKAEIGDLDRTIAILEEEEALQPKETKKAGETPEDLEVRSFENFVRGVVEQRANVTLSANGAVIPSSIAKKIIKKVYDICPIYQLATHYDVKGNFSIPYYDEDTDKITVEYATEFTDPTAHGGKFLSIELKGFLARAFSLISKSLINNSSFDVVSFIVNDMSQGISSWIEKELLCGTTDKVEGLKGVKKVVTALSATAVTADEAIDLQESVSDQFQTNSIFIMGKATRTALRKLKDSDGNYLLNRDVTAKWGYTLLGKPVYTSDHMPEMAVGVTAIYYGDMSGLAVKVSENINVQVLREKYAEQHAIGVVGFVEIDAKVENAQKIAKLVMNATAK